MRQLGRNVVTTLIVAFALCASSANAKMFTVNTNGSALDADAMAPMGDDLECDTNLAMGGFQCTLNAAIQEANDQTGPHMIVFASSITAIQLGQSLDLITAPVTIDGTNASAPMNTQMRVDVDANNTGCFQLAATATGANADGAEGSTITNLIIRGCQGDAVSINSGHGYTISNNRIGLMPDGESADANSGDGISIAATVAPPTMLPDVSDILDLLPQNLAGVAGYSATISALLSSIAPPVFITGNHIGGNDQTAINIFAQSINVVVAGNLIGLDDDGTDAIPNGTGGGAPDAVVVTAGSYGNFIGPGNVISGNANDGLRIDSQNVLLPNIVMGNVVGLGLVALGDVGNQENGVSLASTPDDDDSGMNNPKNPTGYSVLFGPANVVSDNLADPGTGPDVGNSNSAGLLLDGRKVRVFGNLFGLAAFPAGGTPIASLDYGNAGNGIEVVTGEHEIGGSQPFEANFITGNGRHGLFIRNGATDRITVRGNFIGVTDPTTLDILDFGNGFDGIYIMNAGSVTVGGPGEFDDNVIAGNGRHGIKVFDEGSESDEGWANLFQRNQIYGNDQDSADAFTGIGIDLDRTQNGVDPVVDDDDPNLAFGNYNQNAPQICTGLPGQLAQCTGGVTQASYSGGTTTLQWTVQTGNSRTYRAEFFARTPTSMTFLGEQMVTTDANGLPNSAGCAAGRCTSAITPMAPADTRAQTLVMTITDLTLADVPPDGDQPAPNPLSESNNTSEFSNGIVIPDPGEVRFVNLPANLAQMAAENAGTATFQVERVNGSDGAVSVDLQVTGGTATNPTDFTLGTVTASWAAGESGVKNVTVNVADDMTDEPDETVLLGLGNATGMAEIVSPSAAQLTITDNDNPPSVSIDDVTLAEGTGGATTAFTFTATLSAASSFTVTVDAASAMGGATPATPGVDYTVLNTTALTFVPGDTSETVTVLVAHDAMDETAETFLVNLTNPSQATLGDGQGLGTIQNDDFSFAIGDALAVAEGNAATTTLSYTITRSGDTSMAASVTAASADGTATLADMDYQQLMPTVVNFGIGVAMQTVMVTVNGDVTTETDETVLVNLSMPSAGAISDAQGTGTITNDDAPPTISIGDAGLAEGNAGTTPFAFTVTLSNPSSQTVTVDAASADGTATLADMDYQQLMSTPVTFVPGDTSEMVTVQVVGDMTDEPAPQDFNVNLSGPTNASILDGTGVGSIQNDDAPLAPSFAIADAVAVPEGAMGTTNLVFTITRSGVVTGTDSVTAASADGTATLADVDYAQLPATLVTFAPLETTKMVMVAVTGDAKFETDETVLVNLTLPTAGSISDPQGSGTITNDDAQPTVSINDFGMAEGNAGTTPFAFTVTLSNPSSQSVTVNAASADGTATLADSDYQQLMSTPVTFVPGDVSEMVTVQVVGDVVDEPAPQDFTVVLSAPANASIGDGTGVGSIQNDDAVLAPSFAIGDAVAVLEGAMGTTNLVFTITRSAVITGTDSVTAASADGTATLADGDYAQLMPSIVTFAPMETTKMVMVAVNGDATFETDETVLVNLTLPSAGSISDPQGSGTITNDDAQPTISIADLTLAEGNAGTTPFAFTVTLSNPSSQSVSVSAMSADGTATLADADYQQLAATTITFVPGDVGETVTVNVVGDMTDEPAPQDFSVVLGMPTNATIGDGTGIGSIANDDAPVAMFSIADAMLAEGNAATAPLQLTVTRSGDLSGTVTVEASSANGTATAGSDYAALATTVLTFAPMVTTQTVDVTVNGDTTFEPDETFLVNLANASSGNILDPQATGTITNDDAQPTISIADLSTNEGNAGSTPFAFAVTLSNASSQTITVSAASSAGTATVGTDYTALAATTVTFVPGDVAETVTVNVAGDTTPEASETFFVDLAAPANATIADAQALGTIANDDQPVTTFNGTTPGGPFTGTIVGGGPFCGFVATTQLIASPPGLTPVPPTLPVPNAQFPYGMFQATLGNCTSGATVNFTYTYAAALPPGTVFWKYGREAANQVPHWYQMPASIVGNTVTFAITDGGQGDDDLVANGSIVDPAGPAFVGQIAGPTTVGIPTLGAKALLLLGLLMLAIGFFALRRDRRAVH